MPTVINDLRTVEDLCTGLAFFGTGGGGRIEAGLGLLAPAIRAGRHITLVSPDELPADAWTCWAIIVGGKDPDEPPPAEELVQFGLEQERYGLVERLVTAARELAAFAGVNLGALVSMELSSAATAATIVTGLELGVPTLDGDYVGRAIPELCLSKMELLGRPPTPVVMVDRWGNIAIIKSAVGAAMVDRLGRMVSRAAYGRGIGTTGHLVQVRDARPALVRGSLLQAIRAGAALRAGIGSPDPLRPLIELTGGRVLCEAEAVATEWRDTEPYTFRELTYRLRGVGASAGADYRIWVKNEHHVVWRDETVVATSPDVIAVLDADTLRPLTTLGDVTPGRRVVVFAMRALDPVWHTPAGLALLGPRHFGLDFDYVPFDRDP
ncbi:MAG: DUF917 domain-containing protein [Armatimonadota bacterium]|nr:DUF917 domain-containing protein [Armatimonadota bacterium]MDR7548645.1 DUF917 domain-containing protein [Armatimonadota bacterium]